MIAFTDTKLIEPRGRGPLPSPTCTRTYVHRDGFHVVSKHFRLHFYYLELNRHSSSCEGFFSHAKYWTERRAISNVECIERM